MRTGVKCVGFFCKNGDEGWWSYYNRGLFYRSNVIVSKKTIYNRTEVLIRKKITSSGIIRIDTSNEIKDYGE